MKSVLISIRPQWVEKITSRKKTIEVRKTSPKEVPFKAYIYCTKEKSQCRYSDYEGAYENSKGKIVYAQQHIIGEFICDKVYKIEPIFSFYDSYSGYDDSSDCSYFEDYSIDNERLKKTCLTQQDLCVYGNGNRLYGWHISNLKINDKPKELSEFFTPMGKRPSYMIERPPQSWQYVEELENEQRTAD